MAVPKKKTTRKRRGDRRAHQALKPLHLVKCLECGAWRRPHRVCVECGYYRGRQVLIVESKEQKAERKKARDKALRTGKRPVKRAPQELARGVKEQAAQPLSLEQLSRRPTGDR